MPAGHGETSDDFIIALYCRVDQVLHDVPKHAQAHLYPSEVVTLGLLFALNGAGPRAFYRCVQHTYAQWFPALPERTRPFRLFDTHAGWTEAFLAQPTVLGVADTYGIELRHPWRENPADRQIGGKGLSNHRWIVGATFAYVLNQHGLVVAWDYAGANVSDTAFHSLSHDVADEMVIFTDTGFHAKQGDPTNLKPCKRGTWNVRMVVETVLSMLTTVSVQEAHSSYLAGYSESAGVHNGALQHSGAMEWSPDRRRRKYSPLNRGI